MKRRSFSILLILVILIYQFQITFHASGQDTIKKQEIERTYRNTPPKLQIPIISDVHIGGENEKQRFARALNDYKNIAPNYKVMAVVGDLTNHGYTSEYKGFMEVLKNNKTSNSEMIITMGNHEFFGNKNYPKPDPANKVLLDRFINMTGMTNTHYDKWIEGYHFIALCTEEARVLNPINQGLEILSENEYAWLKEKLKEKADPKKPIFVFLHAPISVTVYGSEWWGAELKNKRLVALLKQYPQVILFSGHSHYLLNHPRTVYQEGFTAVNTGAIGYICSAGDKIVPNSSQGLLVNVFDNKVEIKTREFTTNTWISTYTIKLPYKKTIGIKYPYFYGNARNN